MSHIVWFHSSQDPLRATKTLQLHVYLAVKTLLWLNKNVPNPPTSWYLKAPKWVIEQSKHQNRETNFYRRCLNSEPNRAARSSSSEGVLSGWVSGFGRQADVVWSCPLGFCDMWTLFEIILAGFCDERWHYLTVSWHYPPGHLWISLCLTLSQKHEEFRMDTKMQTNFTIYFWFSLATASYFQFGSLYVVLYLYFVFVEGLVCVWFARGQVTGLLSRGRVAGAGVDKWPYFVGERSPPSWGRPSGHTLCY